jgi:hypothetical protein
MGSTLENIGTGLERPPTKKERTGLRGCHVHMATERYQEAGFHEEAYAVPTDKFRHVEGAVN